MSQDFVRRRFFGSRVSITLPQSDTQGQLDDLRSVALSNISYRERIGERGAVRSELQAEGPSFGTRHRLDLRLAQQAEQNSRTDVVYEPRWVTANDCRDDTV